jgi:Na+/melibiose symporter-like transporter
MQTLSKIYTLLNTFSRLLWGLLYDKFGFKNPYRFVCINQIICSSLIYLSANNIYTYFICCCFGVLSFSGHIILFPNLITKKFGIDHSVTLLGVCGILGGTTCLLGPVLTSIIIKKESDYLITYVIAGSTTIVSLILTFIIKIERMKKSALLVQENNTENVTEKIEEKNKENNEVNTLENTEDNTIESNKDNNIENTHDNTLENNKDNIIESNMDNTKSNNAKENMNENITDNNQDNIIENKEKIIDDNINGKEENINENLKDNKEEKLIEN